MSKTDKQQWPASCDVCEIDADCPIKCPHYRMPTGIQEGAPTPQQWPTSCKNCTIETCAGCPNIPARFQSDPEPAQEVDPGTCRVCGCDDEHACETESGPCCWVEPGLCSACVTLYCSKIKKWDTCPEQPNWADCKKEDKYQNVCGYLGWTAKDAVQKETPDPPASLKTDVVGILADRGIALNQELSTVGPGPDLIVIYGCVSPIPKPKDVCPEIPHYTKCAGCRQWKPVDAKELPTVQDASLTTGYELADIGIVYPNPNNPRKHFDQESLDELAESVRQVGILEPILVVRDGTRLRIVAGERRYRAALAAGLKEAPVIVHELAPDQELTVMLTENLKRKDLDPIEEAQAFKMAIDRGWKQEELAAKLGLSQSQISNRLRLLKLPEPIRENISREILSAGHGLALVKVANSPKIAEKLAGQFVTGSVSANSAEKHVEDYVSMNARPLFKTYNNGPVFDPDKFCGKCPNRVLAKSYYQGGDHKHPHCIDHACWDRYQEEAQERKAEELRKQIDIQAEEVAGADGRKAAEVVDLRNVQHADYETFHGDLVDPDDCAGCEFLRPTVWGYDGPALACFKPYCFQEKKKKAESLKNREERRQKKDFEQVKDEIIARGLFDEAGQVRRDVLSYMAAEVVEHGPSSGLWTRAKIEAELRQQFGWEIDDNKPWPERTADLMRIINSLNEASLWRVLLFCILRPAEHTSPVYKYTIGASDEEVMEA